MRAGDLVRVDFGIPIGSGPGFVRPAIVVTADLILAGRPRTMHVVPVTSNVVRRLPTEIDVKAASLTVPSVAQCHLCTVVSAEHLVEGSIGDNVGAVTLAQIRSVLADLFDIA